MATTDAVIINMIIRQQGTIEAINGLRNVNRQVQETEIFVENLAERYDVSMDRILRDIERYNAGLQNMQNPNMTQLNPAAVGLLRNQLPQIEEQRQREAALMRDREDAHARRMYAIQEEAEAENRVFETNRIQVANQARAVDAVATRTARFAEIASLPTPYKQTQALSKEVLALSKSTGVATDEILRLVAATHRIDPTVIKNTTKNLHEMKNGIVDSIREMVNFKAILNTAFGVGMAMLLFTATQAIQQFFTASLQSAKDYANAFANLRVGEQILSEEGFKITGKEIMAVLDALDKKLKFISRTDITKGLGSALNQLSTRGVTAAQAGKIVEIAAIVKLKSPDKDVNEIVANITNGILTGTSEATKNIGLQFDDLRVKQKAKELGLISDTTKTLTEQEKVQARIALAVDYANQKLGASLEQVDKQTIMLAQANKEWQDIQLKLGQVILPLLVDITGQSQGFLDIIDKSLDKLKEFLVLREFQHSVLEKYNEQASWDKKIFIRIGDQNIIDSTNRLIKEMGLSAKDVDKMMEDARSKYFPTMGDTATGNKSILGGNSAALTEEESKKIQSSLRSLANALDQFGDRARQMEENFKDAMVKASEDFNLSSTRAYEDYAIERQRIIDDSNKKIADKNQQAKRDLLDKEAKFQEQLRQLREKYLMSLDDALHERDARAVLRLAREYAMNKQNMINEHALEMSKTGTKNEVAQIKSDTADRLRILDEEFNLKQKRAAQDFKIKMKRMEYEHSIEMRRLEHEKQDRLHQVAEELGDTFGLNSDGVRRLYNLFDTYFGEHGAIGSLVKYQYDNITAYTEAMLKDLSILLQQYKITTTAISGTGITTTNPYGTNTHVYPGQTTSNLTPTTTTATRLPVGTNNVKRASGGLDLVNKPTSVLMGESGPEAHLFVPLNKLSSLFGGINNLSSMNLNQNNNSKVELLVDLSPDLETRVVKKSMDELANVVMQVRKARA